MARQDAKCYILKEEKKKTYVTSKVWYREFSRISNIGIAIIEKWIAFRDRDALNSNPVSPDNMLKLDMKYTSSGMGPDNTLKLHMKYTSSDMSPDNTLKLHMKYTSSGMSTDNTLKLHRKYTSSGMYVQIVCYIFGAVLHGWLQIISLPQFQGIKFSSNINIYIHELTFCCFS